MAAERLAECGLVDPVVDEPVADCGLVDPVVDEAAECVNAAWSGDQLQKSAWTDKDERVSWQTWYSEESECQTEDECSDQKLWIVQQWYFALCSEHE